MIAHLEEFVLARRCDVMDASLHLITRLLEAIAEPGQPAVTLRFAGLVEQRKLRELLRLWPGLLPTAPDLFLCNYPGARNCAATATGKPEDAFPARCPWTLAEAMAVKWPRGSDSA